MGRENASACYRELGAGLRRLRDVACLTGDDIARDTGWHRSKVSRVEKGQCEIDAVDVCNYLAACKVLPTDAVELIAICGAAKRKLGYWVSPYVDATEDTLPSLTYHEATADHMTDYAPLTIPTLLQTQGYARARIGRDTALTPHTVDAAVHARMLRKEILHRLRAGKFTFFVHEQALHAREDDAEVMHEQLLAVALVAATPQVSLRVLPSASCAGGLFGGPFQIFGYREYEPIAYISAAGKGIFLEGTDALANYRRLLVEMSSVAMRPDQSRTLVAELADALVRETDRSEAAIYELNPDRHQDRRAN